MVSIPASGPSCQGFDALGSIQNIPEFFQVLLWLINSAALKESWQWPENVDQTHLVELARDKLVLQKVFSLPFLRLVLFEAWYF